MSKYRNKITEVDGIKFHSKKEAKRWGELKLLEKAGEIRGLIRQNEWYLTVNGILICKYKCDFEYLIGNKLVVEDVKSSMTKKLPVYRLKKKLMLAIHKIEIKET